MSELVNHGEIFCDYCSLNSGVTAEYQTFGRITMFTDE